ncbi:MAG: hypothetical protein AAGD11_15240 [Planctomycetota bacterium]
MTSRQDWYSLFSRWPASLPRKGVLVTSLNETIIFKDFWLKDELLLVERLTPDSMGARFVILNFEVINVVKFTNPLTAQEIASAGFSAEVVRRQAETVKAATPIVATAVTAAPTAGTPRTPVAER